jgi:hypothetical protein
MPIAVWISSVSQCLLKMGRWSYDYHTQESHANEIFFNAREIEKSTIMKLALQAKSTPISAPILSDRVTFKIRLLKLQPHP